MILKAHSLERLVIAHAFFVCKEAPYLFLARDIKFNQIMSTHLKHLKKLYLFSRHIIPVGLHI